jgi:MerR HTH family regulatory protein
MIGDFSRATHLSVKLLRHFRNIGLLEPAAVDPDTGYRRYGTGQISAHLARLEASLARAQDAVATGPMGRVAARDVPAAELATAVHARRRGAR